MVASREECEDAQSQLSDVRQRVEAAVGIGMILVLPCGPNSTCPGWIPHVTNGFASKALGNEFTLVTLKVYLGGLEFRSYEHCSEHLLVDDYRDYTTHHIGYYNNPIGESLLTKQYSILD